MSTDPHHREAAAAEAAMAEMYGSVWKPKPGDRVRCPKAFGGGYQDGTVVGAERDGWLVDTTDADSVEASNSLGITTKSVPLMMTDVDATAAMANEAIALAESLRK
jgi:hypothetical protein